MYRLNIAYKQFYITSNDIWFYESDPNAPSTCSEPGGKQRQHNIRGWHNWPNMLWRLCYMPANWDIDHCCLVNMAKFQVWRGTISNWLSHYTDVIMTEGASQITSLTIAYSAVYSGWDQRKHQSSALLAFVRGIHRDRWIPRAKGQ